MTTKIVLLISWIFGISGGLIFLARGNGFGVLIAATAVLSFFSTQAFVMPGRMKWPRSGETRRVAARFCRMTPEQFDAHRAREAQLMKHGCAACCLMAGMILFFFSIVVDQL